MEAIIWSRDNCAWCERAKTLLDSRGIHWTERKIGSGWTREQLLESVPGARTVPQIFLDGRHIGGYTDLVEVLS